MPCGCKLPLSSGPSDFLSPQGDNCSDRAKTDVAVMAWLALHATEDGTVIRSLSTMTNYIPRSGTTIHKSIKRLVASENLSAPLDPVSAGGELHR